MEQFFGCGMTYPRCKEDCYWYEEWQDMGAHIPYCRCKKTDYIEPKDCENCEQYHSKHEPTNADRVRAMTDEELAGFLDDIAKGCDACPKRRYCLYEAEEHNCREIFLKWLKQEADG